jgi:hypothetical protein
MPTRVQIIAQLDYPTVESLEYRRLLQAAQQGNLTKDTIETLHLVHVFLRLIDVSGKVTILSYEAKNGLTRNKYTIEDLQGTA